MKKAYFLLLVLSSIISYSQTWDELKSNLKLLTEEKTFELDSTGISKLPNVAYGYAKNRSRNFWHVQDLNNDGKNDLIYSGPTMPYDGTSIFLNINDKLELYKEYPGKLIAIKKKKGGTKLSILASSCCCDYYSSFKEVFISSNSLFEKYSISIHHETELTVSEKLITKKISGVVRYSADEKNEITKDVCTDDSFVGNQIDEINNQLVYVVDVKKNWNLILYESEGGKFKMGWVKIIS